MPRARPIGEEEIAPPLPAQIQRYREEYAGLRMQVTRHRADIKQRLISLEQGSAKTRANIEATVGKYKLLAMESSKAAVLQHMDALAQAPPELAGLYDTHIRDMEAILEEGNSLIYNLELDLAEREKRVRFLEYNLEAVFKRAEYFAQQVAAIAAPGDYAVLEPLAEKIFEIRLRVGLGAEPPKEKKGIGVPAAGSGA